MRNIAIVFLALQGTAILAWWVVLLAFPQARAPLLAPGVTETTLLAFTAGDWLLYGGGSLAAAYGLATDRAWAWSVLCLHAGAGIYAALWGLSVPLLGGGGWLGAAMMLPTLVVLPVLLWWFKPKTL